MSISIVELNANIPDAQYVDNLSENQSSFAFREVTIENESYA